VAISKKLRVELAAEAEEESKTDIAAAPVIIWRRFMLSTVYHRGSHFRECHPLIRNCDRRQCEIECHPERSAQREVEGSTIARGRAKRVPHLREAKVGLQDSDAPKMLTRHATAWKK
jgi:hypothetical protein